MTEKRFFILTDDEYDIRPCIRDRTFKIEDIYGDYKYDDLDEICNEFNCLNDENEQLKHDASVLVQSNKDYRIENEQLKSDNKCYVKRYSELFEDYIACKKENEQLKKQIERIDFILDDLNGAEYISRDDGIKALNKIDKVIGKR